MAIPIGPIGPLLELYRKAWRDAGHPGDGEVMVAFHMFCHEDARLAREIARPPFEEYFRALNEAVGDWARGTTSKDYRDYDTSMRRLRSFTLDGQIEVRRRMGRHPRRDQGHHQPRGRRHRQVRACLPADQFRRARATRGAEIHAAVRSRRHAGVCRSRVAGATGGTAGARALVSRSHAERTRSASKFTQPADAWLRAALLRSRRCRGPPIASSPFRSRSCAASTAIFQAPTAPR